MKSAPALVVLMLCSCQAFAKSDYCEQITTLSGNVAVIQPNSEEKSINKIWDCIDAINKFNPRLKTIHLKLPSIKYRLNAPLLTPISSIDHQISVNVSGENTVISGSKDLLNWKHFVPINTDDWPLIKPFKELFEVSLSSSDAAAIRGGMPRSHGEKISIAPPELIVDGELFEVASWPKNGEFKITDVNESKKQITANLGILPGKMDFVFLQGNLIYEWADATVAASLNPLDKINNWVLTVKDVWPKYGAKIGGTFHLQGIASMITRPGQYAILPDRDAIIFWPKKEPNNVELTNIKNVLIAQNAIDLNISDLSFEGTRGTAVSLRGIRIHFNKCVIRNVGTVGLKVEGKDITVSSSKIYNTGASGVEMQGGDRDTLTPGRIVFKDGIVNNFGRRIWSSLPGIRVDGVGNAVLNSKISVGPHSGIFYFGNDHEIAGNEISDVAQRTGDVGVIYTGRDWAGRGHHVHDNYIHDVVGKGVNGATALYIDDQSSGVDLRNNIIWNVHRGVLIGGGRDNVVTQNLFIKTPICLRFDARGLTWQADKIKPGGEIWIKYFQVPSSGPLYRSKYPGVADIPDNNPGIPVNNVITENSGINCTWTIDDKVRQYNKISRNANAESTVFTYPSVLNLENAPNVDKLGVNWQVTLKDLH